MAWYSLKQVTKKYTNKEPKNPVEVFLALKSCRPIEFFVVHVALVTTTRVSSVCQPRMVKQNLSHTPICGALWRTGKAGATNASWQNHKKRSLFRRIVAGATSAHIYPAAALGLVPAKKQLCGSGSDL